MTALRQYPRRSALRADLVPLCIGLAVAATLYLIGWLT